MKVLALFLLASLIGNGYQYVFSRSLPQEGEEAVVKKVVQQVEKRPLPEKASLKSQSASLCFAYGKQHRPQTPPPPVREEQRLEAQKSWGESLRHYFEAELSLEQEDYAFYQKSIEELKEQRGKIYQYFSERARDRGWTAGDPYVPSFEEERATLRAKEAAIIKLSRRFSSEKVKQLLEHERKLKETMLQERGYSPSQGIL